MIRVGGRGLKTGEPKSSRVIGSDPSCNRAEVESSPCRRSCRTRRAGYVPRILEYRWAADTFVNASKLGEERKEKIGKRGRAVGRIWSRVLRSISILAFRGWHYWKSWRDVCLVKNWIIKLGGIFSSVTLSSNRTNPLTFQLDIPINFAIPPNPFDDR